MIQAAGPSPEELDLLSQVIGDVARRRRLSPDEAQDFSQTVHVTLIERNYDVFERFSGRSSLRTYLTVVVDRVLLDWRRTTRGTWRPSVLARTLGLHAVLLDGLIHRDHYPRDEAISIVQSRGDAPPEAALRRLADLLPAHHSRRIVPLESFDTIRGATVEDPVEQRERKRVEARIRRALRNALMQLPSEDSRLIDLRYRQRQRVPAIARALQVDAKALYRRCDRVLRSLRLSLEAACVAGSCVMRQP